MAAKVQVKGLRELGVAFKAMSDDMVTKTSRAMVNAAAQVVRKAAIAAAPQAAEPHRWGRSKTVVAPGTLKRNIIIKRLRPSDTSLTQEYIIGVRHGSGKPDRDAFYWLFVEFGTVKMAARPFLRPALANNKQQASDQMVAVGRRRIAQAAARLRKGSK